MYRIISNLRSTSGSRAHEFRPRTK